MEAKIRNPRVVVLKSARVAYLFDGDRLVRQYPIRLGVDSKSPKRRVGDGRTPVGRFRIVTKNSNSPHFRFLGINYPDRSATFSGLATGLISFGEARAIDSANQRHHCPPWGTALGGAIGLHGAGDDSPVTAGCIALSDAHIVELFDVLRMGDTVEILP